MGEVHKESGRKRRETLQGSELGARAAREIWGVLVPGCVPGRVEVLEAPRQKQFGQAGTAAPLSCSLLLAVEKADFLPKTAPTWDMQRLLPLPGKSETLSRPQCSAWVSWHLAPSPPTFPSPLSILFSTPSLLRCCRFPAPSPRPRCPGCSPKWATGADNRHRSSASALLPFLPCSSSSCRSPQLRRSAAALGRRESRRAGAAVSRGLWWFCCPCAGRLGGSPAVSAGWFSLDCLFSSIPALPVSFGGRRSRQARPRWRGVLGLVPAWPLLSRAMPLEDGDPLSPGGRQVNGEVSGVPSLPGMGEPSLRGTTAPGGSRTGVMAKGWEPEPALGDGDVTPGRPPQRARQPEEALMTELSELVQKVVKSSSWWERHGMDISILACSFLLLPAGNLAQPPQTMAGASPGVPLPPHDCFVLGACWHLLRL